MVQQVQNNAAYLLSFIKQTPHDATIADEQLGKAATFVYIFFIINLFKYLLFEMKWKEFFLFWKFF